VTLQKSNQPLALNHFDSSNPVQVFVSPAEYCSVYG